MALHVLFLPAYFSVFVVLPSLSLAYLTREVGGDAPLTSDQRNHRAAWGIIYIGPMIASKSGATC
jgi:hypothetical protein